MKSYKLRQLFLEFFESKGHKVFPSSSLIPMGDASLLFTTAGMVQFKSQFATEDPSSLSYKRATSCQKCLRTSDLELVGKTIRHHTFFEMLGNFSFGDYFKKESIEFAWEFSKEVINLDKSRILVSVYKDDDEAFDLWNKHIGISKDKIVRLGKEDNFWGPAGDTGPCGPCSELYYDLGESSDNEISDSAVGGDNDRYIEYWNLVFNEFNKSLDGAYNPLKYKGVDTGMGLERLTMVSEGLDSVYKTDLFEPIIKEIIKLTNVGKYEDSKSGIYNLISDHIRAISFLLAEDIIPSNEGRGYVIRRLLRRATRAGSRIGFEKPFLFALIDVVCKCVSDYPEVEESKDKIKNIVKSEEDIFLNTLKEGSVYLDNLVTRMEERGEMLIAGEEAFKLYDSMGFPVSLLEEIAGEKGLKVDLVRYEELMDGQRQKARQSWTKENNRLPKEVLNLDTLYLDTLNLDTLYMEESACESRIDYILEDSTKDTLFIKLDVVRALGDESKGESKDVILVLDKTMFYGESGGQVGDVGKLYKEGKEGEIACELKVIDTKRVDKVILHYCRLERGEISIGDKLKCEVELERKKSIARNHSATHLLQKALKDNLGTHVRQLGSLVKDDKLRFDFSHFNALSIEEISRIEKQVNDTILHNKETQIEEMEQGEALSKGALAFFGDKYADKVRTVRLYDSFELCGGTHVLRTGDIGIFKIISESSISSGTRRIEAITGFKAVENYIDIFNVDREVSLLLNIKDRREYVEKIKGLQKEGKRLEKEVKSLRDKLSLSMIDEKLKESLIKISDINYIGLELEAKDIKELKKVNDYIKGRYENIVTLLISCIGEEVYYVASVSNGINGRYKANDIIKEVSSILEGQGGGKDIIAQGRGMRIDKVKNAIEHVRDHIIQNGSIA